MNLKKTHNLEVVLQTAGEMAKRLNHVYISPTHLLAAILNNKQCQAYKFLEEKLPFLLQKLADVTATRFNFEETGTATGNYSSGAKICWNEAREKLDAIKKLKAEREALLAERQLPRTVDLDVVLGVISRITKIPVENLSAEDKKSLLSMEDRLNGRVIGQSEAVRAACRYFRRAKTKLNDPNKPMGSFILLGPTGVGKTLLAKRLSLEISGSEDNLISLDMSEFMEKHTTSRLIGSPPGYVGYEDNNTLAERVRRQPYSVVLFDEIEKAHPDVLDLLLQVLEEGKLTDGQGRVASFRNTLVLMTSNIGAQYYRPKEIGFGARTECDYEGIRQELKRVLRPELINRIEEILIFRSLSKDDIHQVIFGELKEIQKRVGTTIHLADEVVNLLLKEGYSDEYGGRYLRKTMERVVSDTISDAILQETLNENQEMEVYLDQDKPSVRNIAAKTPTEELPTTVNLTSRNRA